MKTFIQYFIPKKNKILVAIPDTLYTPPPFIPSPSRSPLYKPRRKYHFSNRRDFEHKIGKDCDITKRFSTIYHKHSDLQFFCDNT